MPYAPAVGARTMKVRKVLMQAISGRLTWLQAEDILGWRPRTLRRWRQRYRLRGYDGLWDRRRQRPAPRCAPVAEVARIARLYRERSAGFNAAHFHEIAQRDHGVTFGYTFVKRLLQTAGLLPPRRPRGRHRRRREPRPCFGELLHIDGSPHAGLARRPTERQTLIPIINDAAKRVLYAQLVAAESTATGMAALWSVLVTPGLPQALYSDRASWAFYTPKAGAPVDRAQLTQVGRARAQLGVAHLPAYSPAARGRSERLHRTFQDRLVHELAAAGITTVPAANRYLHERFLATYDARFTHPPPIPPQPSCPSARWISPASSVTKSRAPWRRTIRCRSRACACRSTSSRAAAPARGCGCSSAAISPVATVFWLGARGFGHYDASGPRRPAGAPAPPPFSPAGPLPSPGPTASASRLSPRRPRPRPRGPAHPRRRALAPA
jgi:transposase